MKTSSISESVLLLILAMALATFSYPNERTKLAAGESFQDIPPIGQLKGTIVSIQNNDSGTQSWIISGRWKIIETPATGANTSTKNTGFSANLTMIKIDGTGSHRHRLTDFKLSDLHFKNGIYTLSGKVTLITQGKAEPGSENQLIIGIPVKIQIINFRSITIDIDKKVNNHFGNLPIYGIVG